MKIVTVGLCPYLYLSQAKIHSLIIKHLFFGNHQIASMSVSHDTNYFLPDEDSVYYYKFNDRKVPLIPFNSSLDPSIMVYNMIELYKPDVLITVGDFNDYSYIKAVKMFSEHNFKWMNVLVNSSYPINEHNKDAIDSMDWITCVNTDSYEMFKNIFDTNFMSMSNVGFRQNVLQIKEPEGKFRIMTCGKNHCGDNLPMLMQVASELRKDIDLELYVHSSVYDAGDYDLNLVKERFDPNNKFISFPEKYVSLTDGYPPEQYDLELSKSNVFVSIALNAASGVSVFDAISVGCLPLMSDIGSHRDIADLVSNFIPGFEREDFLVPCIEVMTRGEIYINICRPDMLKTKIMNLHNKIKKGGHRIFLQELISSYSRKNFLEVISKAVEAVKLTNPTICVEPV